MSEIEKKQYTIAVDVMGGDHAPEAILEGVKLWLKTYPNFKLALVGQEDVIKNAHLEGNYEIVPASEVVSMGEEDPVSFVRNHPDASICKAFKYCSEGKADGVVTAGPTQVVVVAAHVILRRMPGMKRIALCPTIPALGGPHGKTRLLLDCGANVELKPEHFPQLAEYASLYAQEVLGRPHPLVGLLNIGAEEHKGRDIDREALALLKADNKINFYGNIEPKEFWDTDIDILLSDGYTGNMVMKAIEGTAKEVGHFMKREIKSSFWAKVGYLFMKKPVFNKFKKSMNSDEVGGAQLFGVNGAVVKAHGSSEGYAFFKALELCSKTIESGIVDKMKEAIQE